MRPAVWGRGRFPQAAETGEQVGQEQTAEGHVALGRGRGAEKVAEMKSWSAEGPGTSPVHDKNTGMLGEPHVATQINGSNAEPTEEKIHHR